MRTLGLAIVAMMAVGYWAQPPSESAPRASFPAAHCDRSVSGVQVEIRCFDQMIRAGSSAFSATVPIGAEAVVTERDAFGCVSERDVAAEVTEVGGDSFARSKIRYIEGACINIAVGQRFTIIDKSDGIFHVRRGDGATYWVYARYFIPE